MKAGLLSFVEAHGLLKLGCLFLFFSSGKVCIARENT